MYIKLCYAMTGVVDDLLVGEIFGRNRLRSNCRGLGLTIRLLRISEISTSCCVNGYLIVHTSSSFLLDCPK
jgi:hypothetical protein